MDACGTRDVEYLDDLSPRPTAFQWTSLSLPMPPRRPHEKSRHGCLQCKRRRVKVCHLLPVVGDLVVPFHLS